MRPGYLIFLAGFLRSIGVEVARAISLYEAGSPFPPHFSKKGFWCARLFLALMGGGLAFAYDIQSYILAVHIGASTPVIIESFARRPPGGLPETPASGATPPARRASKAKGKPEDTPPS